MKGVFFLPSVNLLKLPYFVLGNLIDMTMTTFNKFNMTNLLERLPPELMQIMLKSMPDSHTLGAFVRASPYACRVYRDVLQATCTNTFGETLHLAIVAIRSFHSQRPSWRERSCLNRIDILIEFLQQCHSVEDAEFCEQGSAHSAHTITLNELLSLASLCEDADRLYRIHSKQRTGSDKIGTEYTKRRMVGAVHVWYTRIEGFVPNPNPACSLMLTHVRSRPPDLILSPDDFYTFVSKGMTASTHHEHELYRV